MKKLQDVNDIVEFNVVINELHKIYKEWLESFPFDLEIFKHLRADFENELPIIKNNQAIWDKQKNEIVVDIHSNKTFQQFLAQKTTILLSEINTLAILENGKINDLEKHKLDLIIKERRLKLQSQVKWSRFNKPDYIDYISEWLIDEKMFIEEIKPFLVTHSLERNNKKRLPAKWYALLHLIKIEANIENPFTLNENDQLIKSEIKEYGEKIYEFKDGQAFYNEFRRLFTTQKEKMTYEFGKGYKDKLIELSQNNARVIKELKKYPN